MDELESTIHQIETHTSTNQHYYLYFAFDSYEDCIQLVSIINSLRSDDVLNLHINTIGGNLFNTIAVVQAIKNCQGTVIGHAEGLVYSAGSIIFFSCHGMVVQDHCSFLIHDGTGMESGKISDNLNSVVHTSEVIEKLYLDVYQPFFSEEEIQSVLMGEELYLTSDQVNKVLEKLEEDIINEVDGE